LAHAAGLLGHYLDALERDATSPQFAARERLALSYAERVTRREQDVDEALISLRAGRITLDS
jgi:alkylhydroperoxidase family enzyme